MQRIFFSDYITIILKEAASFDRLSGLEARFSETENLIRAVRNTIKAEKRDEMMADEKKFEAFKRRDE